MAIPSIRGDCRFGSCVTMYTREDLFLSFSSMLSSSFWWMLGLLSWLERCPRKLEMHVGSVQLLLKPRDRATDTCLVEHGAAFSHCFSSFHQIDRQWCGLSWGRRNKRASRRWSRPVFWSISQCRNARKNCCWTLYASSDKVHTVPETPWRSALCSQ